MLFDHAIGGVPFSRGLFSPFAAYRRVDLLDVHLSCQGKPWLS